MNEWRVDGWKTGWISEWNNGWIDGCTDGGVNRWKSTLICKQI